MFYINLYSLFGDLRLGFYEVELEMRTSYSSDLLKEETEVKGSEETKREREGKC